MQDDYILVMVESSLWGAAENIARKKGLRTGDVLEEALRLYMRQSEKNDVKSERGNDER